MAATLKREMKDVLRMEIRPIKKKIVLKGTQKKLKLFKNLQKFVLAAIRGYLGPENVNIFRYNAEGKPISRNSKLGTPQVPINKNQGQTPSFPSNPQHQAVLPSIYKP